MAAVSEAIVREFLELHGFLVRQHRKYIAPARRDDEEIDFFAVHPDPQPIETPLPFVLEASHMNAIARAVVVVKGWHTETFSPGLLANAPEIFRFVEPPILQQTAKAFEGDAPVLKLLVVPALPHSGDARTESIEMLRSKGIDAVLPFRTILADLISHIEINRNYQKSDVLQMIRILKNYDFFKEPQLELFKAGRRKRVS